MSTQWADRISLFPQQDQNPYPPTDVYNVFDTILSPSYDNINPFITSFQNDLRADLIKYNHTVEQLYTKLQDASPQLLNLPKRSRDKEGNPNTVYRYFDQIAVWNTDDNRRVVMFNNDGDIYSWTILRVFDRGDHSYEYTTRLMDQACLYFIAKAAQ